MYRHPYKQKTWLKYMYIVVFRLKEILLNRGDTNFVLADDAKQILIQKKILHFIFLSNMFNFLQRKRQFIKHQIKLKFLLLNTLF